jgi:hypothetical protein
MGAQEAIEGLLALVELPDHELDIGDHEQAVLGVRLDREEAPSRGQGFVEAAIQGEGAGQLENQGRLLGAGIRGEAKLLGGGFQFSFPEKTPAAFDQRGVAGGQQ